MRHSKVYCKNRKCRILFTAVLFCHLDARRSGCPPWRGSAGHCKVASFKKKRELFARDSVTRKLHVLSNEVWLLGQNNGSRPCLTFSDTPSMIYRYDFFSNATLTFKILCSDQSELASIRTPFWNASLSLRVEKKRICYATSKKQ